MNEQQPVKAVQPEPLNKYERPTLTSIGVWNPQVIALSLPVGAYVPILPKDEHLS